MVEFRAAYNSLMATLATERALNEFKRATAIVGEVGYVVELREITADKARGNTIAEICPIESAPFVFGTKGVMGLRVECGDVFNKLVENI